LNVIMVAVIFIRFASGVNEFAIASVSYLLP
jgi:hypothetical protein